MIYTRFGTPVIIIGGDIQTGEVTVGVVSERGSKIIKTYMNELKADDGLNEICEAIKEATT